MDHTLPSAVRGLAQDVRLKNGFAIGSGARTLWNVSQHGIELR
jgi:hypothetical protein